jgi:hypothetical protein
LGRNRETHRVEAYYLNIVVGELQKREISLVDEGDDGVFGLPANAHETEWAVDEPW